MNISISHGKLIHNLINTERIFLIWNENQNNNYTRVLLLNTEWRLLKLRLLEHDYKKSTGLAVKKTSCKYYGEHGE